MSNQQHHLQHLQHGNYGNSGSSSSSPGSRSSNRPQQQQQEQRFGPYIVGETIGRGSFGKVKIAVHDATRVKVALKIIPRKVVEADSRSRIKLHREIRVLRLINHPHIMRLYDVVQTRNDIVLVLELVSGGELFDYLSKRGRLDEEKARLFFQQIISAVAHCHNTEVVHRDLKPENILVEQSHTGVKIADFGLSSLSREGKLLETSCGTPNYAAPEVVSGRLYIGKEADIWSCGVILFTMLAGTLPFDDDHLSALFKKIQSASYTMPNFISPAAQDLISKILVVNPLERATSAQILNHPWVRQGFPPYLVILHQSAISEHKIYPYRLLRNNSTLSTFSISSPSFSGSLISQSAPSSTSSSISESGGNSRVTSHAASVSPESSWSKLDKSMKSPLNDNKNDAAFDTSNNNTAQSAHNLGESTSSSNNNVGATTSPLPNPQSNAGFSPPSTLTKLKGAGNQTFPDDSVNQKHAAADGFTKISANNNINQYETMTKGGFKEIDLEIVETLAQRFNMPHSVVLNQIIDHTSNRFSLNTCRPRDTLIDKHVADSVEVTIPLADDVLRSDLHDLCIAYNILLDKKRNQMLEEYKRQCNIQMSKSCSIVGSFPQQNNGSNPSSSYTRNKLLEPPPSSSLQSSVAADPFGNSYNFVNSIISSNVASNTSLFMVGNNTMPNSMGWGSINLLGASFADPVQTGGIRGNVGGSTPLLNPTWHADPNQGNNKLGPNRCEHKTNLLSLEYASFPAASPIVAPGDVNNATDNQRILNNNITRNLAIQNSELYMKTYNLYVLPRFGHNFLSSSYNSVSSTRQKLLAPPLQPITAADDIKVSGQLFSDEGPFSASDNSAITQQQQLSSLQSANAELAKTYSGKGAGPINSQPTRSMRKRLLQSPSSVQPEIVVNLLGETQRGNNPNLQGTFNNSGNANNNINQQQAYLGTTLSLTTTNTRMLALPSALNAGKNNSVNINNNNFFYHSQGGTTDGGFAFPTSNAAANSNGIYTSLPIYHDGILFHGFTSAEITKIVFYILRRNGYLWKIIKPFQIAAVVNLPIPTKVVIQIFKTPEKIPDFIVTVRMSEKSIPNFASLHVVSLMLDDLLALADDSVKARILISEQKK